MSGWETPPIAEESAAKSMERIVWVHPLDHSRLVEYVGLLFDTLITDCKGMDGVLLFLKRHRINMIDLIIPNPEVPANYLRMPTGQVSFFECAVTKFYVGLEDRKYFNTDIERLQSALAMAI